MRGTGTRGNDDVDDDIVHRTAMRLHYREYSSIMYTISDLVRHRVEAYDVVTSSSSSETGGRNAILAATDQLLEAGLIGDLIEYVRETTRLVRLTRDGMDRIEGEVRIADGGGWGGTGMEGGGGERAVTGTTTAIATPPSRSGSERRDGEGGERRRDNMAMRALLGYYITQRQIASETLFFLAYHTQFEISEVASLIGLIRELTNGGGGIGTGDASDDGLALLEPWSDDVVPSPYVAVVDVPSWQRQQLQRQQVWQQLPGGGLFSLRNHKSTNSYDKFLDRSTVRRSQDLRYKKAEFQFGTHV